MSSDQCLTAQTNDNNTILIHIDKTNMLGITDIT